MFTCQLVYICCCKPGKFDSLWWQHSADMSAVFYMVV